MFERASMTILGVCFAVSFIGSAIATEGKEKAGGERDGKLRKYFYSFVSFRLVCRNPQISITRSLTQGEIRCAKCYPCLLFICSLL